ncbi:MAG TPA: hypothetical protein VK025_01180, partial [Steroidobacter sp.]|nr:hypothetical protein [Steroidobacter sp.]
PTNLVVSRLTNNPGATGRGAPAGGERVSAVPRSDATQARARTADDILPAFLSGPPLRTRL